MVKICNSLNNSNLDKDKCNDLNFNGYVVLKNSDTALDLDNSIVKGAIKDIEKDTYINGLTPVQLCGHLKAINKLIGTPDYVTFALPSDETRVTKIWNDYCSKLKEKLTPEEEEVVVVDDDEDDVVVVAPKDVLGCLDPKADNYWCKIEGNDCTNGIPPNVKEGGCEYKQKIPLVYNYGFCNDSKGCDKINLDTGTHEIITLNKKSVKKMYNDYKEMLNSLIKNDMVAGGRVFVPIENSDSFYGEPSDGDIKDLARALTIQAKNTCIDYTSFPYEFVTMYGADGITPLGQFKIEVSKSKEVSCTDRIESLTPWASRKTTRDRVISMLQNQTTVKLDLEKLERYQLTIDAINNLFSGWGMPVYASNDGVIKYTGNKEQTKVNNKKQSNTKETDFNPQQYQNLYNSIDGLSNVLLEEPQGLIKILK
jgi:hypothetical protein